MAVQTKPSADAKAKADKNEVKTEPVVVSEVVNETIEVVEEVAPEQAQPDSLADFKEKMKKEEQPFSADPPQKNFMWPILFVFVIALVVLIGIFLYKQDQNKSVKVNVETSSPTPTAVPEPTKTVDLSKYEIEILNGGGVSGEAGRQRDSLEGEGFIISSVGNADNSDYTDTFVKVKAEVDKDFIAKLKSVLENTFTVGEIEVLPEDSSVPVVVIIGTKK